MDASYFLPFLQPLSSTAELIFYRQHQNGATTMAGLVDELSDVIGSLKAHTLVLLGHSFGSCLALEYIRKHGSANINGLILASWLHNSRFLDPAQKRHPELFKNITSEENRMTEALASLSPDELYRRKTMLWAPAYFAQGWESRGRETLAAIQYNDSAFQSLYSTYLRDFDLAPVLRDMKIPVVGIAGEDDRVVDVSHIREGAALNKAMGLVECSAAGHFPFIECQDVFNSAVLAFLGKVVIKCSKISFALS